MQLFYFPGACALAPHIILEWSGRPFDAIAVDKTELKTPDYLALNPTGQVPALKIENGYMLTQAEAILLFLAEAFEDLDLGPAQDTVERADMHKWLSFFTGDLHPAFFPFFNPGKFLADADLAPAIRQQSFVVIDPLLQIVDRHMKGRDHMLGDRRTILDPYLFVFCRWTNLLEKKLAAYPNLARVTNLFSKDLGVQRALKTQGLTS